MDKWHGWLKEQSGRGSGAVYRCIREGPRPAPAMTAELDPDWHWAHGKNQAVACSDKAWGRIWAKPQSAKPLSEDWLRHLRELPPFPDHPPLTPQQIGSVLRTYSAGKAAGPDGWRIKELKMWTGPLLV